MKTLSMKKLFFCVAAVLLLPGTPAGACFMRSPLPVQVWLDHIEIRITDQVAVKTYDCTFRNPNPRAVVGGTCYMELEPGAQVDNMKVLVDGKEMQAEILDVEKAKQVFTEIVKNGGSPALLEYYGNQLIQTQVPRIAPGGTVKVVLTYTTVLKKRGNLVRIQCLNTNPKALLQPLKSASVTVRINSKQPVKNVYSPTHEVKIEESKGWDVSVVWKQENYLPKHPFVLYYQTDETPVAASLVAHRELDEPGHFMLMLSPDQGRHGRKLREQVLPKDIVFCVDTSGSMLRQGKIDQVREAVRYCLQQLRPQDRFGLVQFNTRVRVFRPQLVPATPQNIQAALQYVDSLQARGGTAMAQALQRSLQMLQGDSSTRVKMIFFSTDGYPTIGLRDPDRLLEQVRKANTQQVRVFVFGQGVDINTRLLDLLAWQNQGAAEYLLPQENLKQKIRHYFNRVGSPLWKRLEVHFASAAGVEEVFPRQLSDLYLGEQVIVVGRYRGAGTFTVTLRGYQGSKVQ